MRRPSPILLKVDGMPIIIHYSFIVMVIAFSILLYLNAGIMGALTVLYLFFIIAMSVLLHEMGHVVVAKKFGLETGKVVLYPIGGIAFLKGDPAHTGHEIEIALAGPAVNFALAVIGLIIFKFTGHSEFFLFNILMGIFNLFPAYPMDGGRVLRSILSKKFGFMLATKISMFVSCIFSIMFFIIGIYYGLISLPIISFVLIFMVYEESKRLKKYHEA